MNMHNKIQGKTLLSTALALGVFAGPTFAALEEVIVTAQKREQSLQDVPMAVTAIGGQLLENNEINSVSDLTKMVPSLKYTPGDNPQNSSIRVRGVGTDVYSSAVEPNVSVVVDSVPLARTSLVNFDFADVERVEVLRGPQGTLFGKNASAGLIHVITRDPHSEFEARGKITFEQPDEFEGDFRKTQLSFSGPLTDTIGARMTVFEKEVGGHIEDLTSGDYLPDNKSWGARLKVRWDVSDVLSLKLIAEHQDMDGQSYPYVTHTSNPEREANDDPIQAGEENRQTRTANGTRSEMKADALTLSMDWTMGDYVISAITGFREADLFNDFSAAKLDGSQVNLESNGGPRSIETFTQEIRLASTVGETLEYTVGALWFSNDLSNDFDRRITDLPAKYVAGEGGLPNLPLPGGIGTFNVDQGFDNTVKTENLGVFGQATWHIEDRWHTTLGLRYIDEKLTATYSNFQDIEDGSTGMPIAAASTSSQVPETDVADTALTGTFSLQYDWGEHSMVYASYSRGYRGRAFDITTSSSAESFNNPVEAETADAIELGIKSRLWDNRLELNVTLFDTIFTDFQAQIVDVSGGGFAAELKLDNAGELQTRGVEIDFKLKPSDAFMVYGSLLYNEAEFNEFVTQCFVGQGPNEGGAMDRDNDGSCDAQDVSGGVLPNAPKYSGSVTGRYDYNWGAEGDLLYAQLTARYQSEVQFQADQHPLTTQESYSVWDLRTGYISTGGRIEVAAYVKNLFQQNYVNAITALSLIDDRRDTTHYLSRDADRMFGVSVAYQW